MSITSTILSLKGAEEQEWKELYNYIIKLEKENKKHKNWVEVINEENHKLNDEIQYLKNENDFLKQLVQNDKKYSYGIRAGSDKE